jgi:hypothetical protein
MTQAIGQSWSAAQRRNGTDQIATNGHDERAEQGLPREQGLREEQGLRRERGLTDERDEPGTRDEQSQLRQHDERAEQGLRRERGLTDERDEPGTRDEQSQLRQHDERAEQGLRRERGLTDERDERGTRDEQGQAWRHDDRGEQGLRRESYRQPGGVQRTMGESDGDRLERSTDWATPATSTGGDALAPVLAAWGQIYTSMFELAADMMKLQQRTFASLMGFADTNAERIASGDQRGRVHDALSASRTSSVVPDQIEQHRR